jgi:glyoxylase-like metal-dependent hydrolase (beta-lactamase superfamily II)
MSLKIAVGDVTIHRIIEQEQPFFEVHTFFPTLGKERYEENRSWMEPRYVDPTTGKLILCIQSHLVVTPHHKILIDTCVGNHKERPTRAFWHKMDRPDWERGLKATGYGVDDIDFVMCTHMHTDHIGWNTRLDNGRWVPTFPKARYVFSDLELEHWTKRYKEKPEDFPQIADSVLPIVEAKRADIVRSDHEINDIVKLIPTPGHTFDHYSVHVGRSGQDAVITGDMIHSPIQARYPELGMMADWDSEQGGRSRRNLFGRFCDTSTLICTAHFPSPSAARITRWDDGFRLVDA